MTRHACAIGIIGLGLLVGAPAWAQPSEPPGVVSGTVLGPDEVVLANGGVLRGTIVALDPGHEVSILVSGTDRPRVVPWQEVANVERGKYAAAPAGGLGMAGPDEAAPPAATEVPGGRGVVRLHIDADKPGVKLVEQVSAAYGVVGGYGFAIEELREVCAAPCGQVIDGRRGQSFYFVGDGVPASSSFTLSGHQGDVTALVEAGSVGLGAGGWALILTGGTAMLLSPLFFVMGILETSSVEYDSATDTWEDRTEPLAPWGVPVGGVVLGTGALMLTGGIVMAALSGTDFELVPAAAPATGASRRARAPRYWLGEF